jgi:hypothetical protein
VYITITAVLKQYYMCLCVSLCVPVCPCVWVCARVCLFVCHKNGNFSEILRSAHPSGSKKELRVTSFAAYGFYVLQILLLSVSTCYTFLLLTLSFHSPLRLHGVMLN